MRRYRPGPPARDDHGRWPAPTRRQRRSADGEITELTLISGERHLRRTLSEYVGRDGRAEDAGHQGACEGHGGRQGLVIGADGAHDAPADLAQLPGLGLGQRVEDQAADLLDMAGRGLGHLQPPLTEVGAQRKCGCLAGLREDREGIATAPASDSYPHETCG
jgi:hypothetical protein